MADFRVLVADDHDIVRRGVCTLIENHSGWQICGEARDGREAVEKARDLRPDVLVLDLLMPGLNGMQAARQILRQNPQQKILILTILDSEQMIHELLRIGVQGYLLKSDAAKDLVAAVEALQRNRTFFNSGIERMVVDGFLHGNGVRARERVGACRLTCREREILQLIAGGRTTREVATTLKLTLKTAESHRSNILRKLNLHSSSELVLYAVRNNILPVDDSGTDNPEGLSMAA